MEGWEGCRWQPKTLVTKPTHMGTIDTNPKILMLMVVAYCKQCVCSRCPDRLPTHPCCWP